MSKVIALSVFTQKGHIYQTFENFPLPFANKTGHHSGSCRRKRERGAGGGGQEKGLGGRGDADLIKGAQTQLFDFPQNEKTRGGGGGGGERGGGGDLGNEKLALNQGGGGIGRHLIESEEALERGVGGRGGWRAGVVGSAAGEGVSKGGGVGVVREGEESLEEELTELKKSCAALVLSQGCLR